MYVYLSIYLCTLCIDTYIHIYIYRYIYIYIEREREIDRYTGGESVWTTTFGGHGYHRLNSNGVFHTQWDE